MSTAAMAAPAKDGLVRIVRRLALVFALSVTIALPGGYFGLQYSINIQHIEAMARLKADDLTALVAANPELRVYPLQLMEKLLLRHPSQLVDDRVTVRDAAGNPLFIVGAVPDAPVLARSAPIYDSGRVLGHVEIARSYRAVVFGTLAAGLVGLLLGVLVYATLLVLPLRALRRVTAALVHETAVLSASRERYRAVTETASQAIITADGAGLIAEWNPAAERMFGYTQAEVISQPLTLLMPRRYRDGHLAGMNRMQAGGERRVIGRTIEAHGLTKAGHEFPLELSLSEWATADGRFFTAIIRDITAREHHQGELRRLAEELERRVEERTHSLEVANRELESFCYSVSHDLRAPLRAIDGFSSLIEQKYAGQLDEQGRNYFERIRAGAARMGNLIDDLLDLSRVSRQEMRNVAVDLSALAREIAEELQAGGPKRAVDWVIVEGVQVTGDPGLLKIFFQNLIGNAWKFSSRREKARIEFGIAEKNGSRAYFVRDNGAGFDMAHLNKLFGAFQRLHSLAEFPGTGIGLATVERIIHRHGGSIWAEGKVDEGATFYFTLRQPL